MGACYSYESEWQEEYKKETTKKKHRRKKKKQPSVIYEEKSVCGQSFASVLEGDFRDSLHETLDLNNSSILQSSLAMGSVVEMSQQQQQHLTRGLALINIDNQEHHDQPFRLCNFKTKNFLHTHKIKLQKYYGNYNEVSCCPYNSNHTLEYDIWELRTSPVDHSKFLIYHPFTNRYMGCMEDGTVFCSEEKFTWEVESLGRRRNLGFLRIRCQYGQLCMTDQKGLIKNHRQITVCRAKHISHLWELIICGDLETER